MKPHRCLVRSCLRGGASIGLILAGQLPLSAQSQITPAQAEQIRTAINNRVEAITILGGDYGLGDGTYNSTGISHSDIDISISKFGGSGDVGNPQQLGGLGIGWQPRLQGSMGYVDAKNDFTSGQFKSDRSESRTFAIQFGGGARFWLNQSLSLAPTFMGMYGHTTNEYTAHSAFMTANLPQARQLGLVDWNANTWTVRPALDIQYVVTWDRTIFTLSSDPTYFYTHSFSSSSPQVGIGGNSETWANKFDVDVPLGKQLFGHELRTGGYLSRTQLFGDIKDGLNTEHLNEVHTRLVLDFLNQLWKAQWIGIGGSYYWGSNFNGWSIGADVAFRF
jgi:Solitary outer membrane autotransporter beta-barrel domain